MRATNAMRTWACAAATTCALPVAEGKACIFTPIADSPTVAQLHDGKELISLEKARFFDPCARVMVKKGTAIVQYIKGKDGAQVPVRHRLDEGQSVNAAEFGDATTTTTVARSLLAVLTQAKERPVLGQKYFDKPAQVGAPFGDVYIPVGGLELRFVNLEGDARVQITDAASQAVLLEGVAAQGMTLDRQRFRAGGTFAVRITSSRGKLPAGAFEVVAASASVEIDKSLHAIQSDATLDATGRAIARALLFEHEGLSFNRELTLKDLKP